MKGYVYLIFIAISLTALALLSGCRHPPDGRLLHAESIMEQHPDSALMILEAMRLSDNAPEGDRALYALLLTHARYKNFIDEDNDSLVRTAADYFIDEGNAGEASRALFLTGMIQMNAGRLGEAAVSFSKGLDIARESHIYMWEGQCARGLFQLYCQLLDGSAQLRYAQEAYEAFSKGGYEDWTDYASLNIARALNNNGRYEEAYSMAADLKDRGEMSSDSILQEEALLLMGMSLAMMGRHAESLDNYAAVFNMNPDILTADDIRLISTAIAGTKPDSISPDLRNFIMDISSLDDYQTSRLVLVKQGKYEEAYRDLEVYKNQQDSVINMIIHSNVVESLGQYETGRKNLELAHSRIRHLVTCIILIAVILVCVLVAWFLREKLRKKEIAHLEAENNLKSTRILLAQEMNTKQKLIDSLSNVARERYESVNETFDSYFRNQNSGNVKKITDVQIKKIVTEFNDDEFLQNVGKIVDKYGNGIFSSFKDDFPNLVMIKK